MSTIKLVALSGSLRKDSANTKLLHCAIAAFGPADVTIADLNLPLYDGDLEAEGLPDPVTRLAAQITSADAIIVANPEYNKGIPGVLKNALDWVSRVPGNAFQGTPTLIVGAAAGRTGGETSYYMTRQCLSALQADVVFGPPVLVAAAYEAFDETGALKSERYQEALSAAATHLRGLL